MKQKSGRISVVTVILCLVILILSIVVIKLVLPEKSTDDFKQVQSYKKLEKIYKGNTSSSNILITRILTLPMSLDYSFGSMTNAYDDMVSGGLTGSVPDSTTELSSSTIKENDTTVGFETSTNKEYSTTNIQVENVDEADVTKTDGNYIYSLSDYNIVITDVRDAKNAKVISKFFMEDYSIPKELLVYNDKLVVIGESDTKTSYVVDSIRSWSRYGLTSNTVIEVFDITDKETPKSIKQLNIRQPYYTCRMIDGNLYILSCGYLRENSYDKIDISYTEDSAQKEINLENMYYMEDVNTTKQTIITGIDLDNLSKSADIKSYFIELDNAYVSENNIYIAEGNWSHDASDNIPVKWLFGFGGIPGLFKHIEDTDYDMEYNTTIYKFSIDGTNIEFVAKTEDDGETINQFSMDEYQGNLRVAMHDDDGTRINVYDSNLKKIGQSESLAKGEDMYSSRFIGERAYLVTYKTMDPLFVVDLSNVTNPKVLGELKIPGYSTYLHPYDENHIIGIGMETKETINRDVNGKIISTSASIVGMKMALFDVTDVSKPKQISSVVIGDSRTTSAILTNHKALLFSKEKNLIAIPVNNYNSDFEVSTSSEDIDDVISAYKNKEKNYIAEGYELYNIDLENGFVKKGTITHDLRTKYSYKTISHLLRGLYIENNLYTVSERMIMINKLDTLELLREVDISNALED